MRCSPQLVIAAIDQDIRVAKPIVVFGIAAHVSQLGMPAKEEKSWPASAPDEIQQKREARKSVSVDSGVG